MLVKNNIKEIRNDYGVNATRVNNMIIQATDGMFYQNPRIVTNDYILTSSTEDGITLYLRTKKNWQRLVHNGGINYRIISPFEREVYPFPPDWKRINTWKVTIDLKGPIPPPTESEAVTTILPTYATWKVWTLRVSMAEIEEIIRTEEIPVVIRKFFINDEEINNSIIKKICKQLHNERDGYLELKK